MNIGCLTPHVRTFIASNYPTKGGRYCADQLGVSYASVNLFASRNKIRTTHRRYRDNVDMSDFTSMTKPEVCYFLGLLFADGWIDHKRVNLSLIKEDFDTVREILSRVYKKATLYDRERPPWKTSTNLTLSSVKLAEFIRCHGFKGNNFECLRYVPIGNVKYFMRGYVDGDGHIKHKKIGNYHKNIVELASTYDFDWSVLEQTFKKLGIRHTVRRYVSPKGHKSSCLVMKACPSILAFCDFIYDGFEVDGMGFPRKREAYLAMKRIYPSLRVTSKRLTVTTPLFEEAIEEALVAKSIALTKSPVSK